MFEKLGPYRKDVQWISGLVFAIVLMLSLFVGGMARVFAPEIAKPAVASLFKDNLQTVLAQNYKQTRRWLKSRPSTESLKIPGIPNVGLTAGQAAKLDAKGLAAKISEKLAAHIYEGKTASFSPQIRQSLGPLVYFKSATYERLLSAARGMAWTAAIFGIIMVLFGRRFGRLFSLGLAFMAAAFLPHLASDLLVSSFSSTTGSPQQAASIAALTAVMKPALVAGRDTADAFLGLGLVLTLLAFLGSYGSRLIAASQKSQTETMSSDTGLQARSYLGTASMIFGVTALPFAVLFGFLMSFQKGVSFGQIFPESIFAGILFGLFFGLIMAVNLKGVTASVEVGDKDEFVSKINVAMSQLGFNPATSSSDFLTFKPSFQAGFLGGRFSVILQGEKATIVGPAMHVNKLLKKLG